MPGSAARVIYVKPDSTWIVERTLTLSKLVIGKNATVAASQGKSVTLTIDGVGTALKPGTYRGRIVLTVTRSIVSRYDCKSFPGCAHLSPEHFRTAIYVEDGRYIAGNSVAAAVSSGSVSADSARDVSITSREGGFNGIIVTGKSPHTYIIDHPRIELSGNGSNDFDGYAAAISSSGRARVLVEGARITTRGVVRSAVFVGGHSTMTINDSTIRTYNGILPPGYRFKLQLGGMLEVPWMLGIEGNARATLLVDQGTAYYNNDHIITQGWGALSTDAVRRTRLYVTKSTIETLDSGYGSYSIGDSMNRFVRCTFRVADMALIMANGGSGTFTDGTVVESRRFGVVVHGPSRRAGTLIIEKGSAFHTRSTAVQVKGVGANIVIDHASLRAGNGLLLQAMVNDDPLAPLPGADADTAVRVTLKGEDLRGDISDSRDRQQGMRVTLQGSRMSGAISTAVATPAGGAKPTAKTYYLIGDVRNRLAARPLGDRLEVSLDGSSSWVIDKTSYLTALTLAKGAQIAAPEGFRVALSVNGRQVPIREGEYVGMIALTISRAADH